MLAPLRPEGAEAPSSGQSIQVLDSHQLDRLQRVLDHIAYDKEYYMPERYLYRVSAREYNSTVLSEIVRSLRTICL